MKYTLQYPRLNRNGGVLEWIDILNEEFDTEPEARRRAVQLQPRYPFPIVVVIPTRRNSEQGKAD